MSTFPGVGDAIPDVAMTTPEGGSGPNYSNL